MEKKQMAGGLLAFSVSNTILLITDFLKNQFMIKSKILELFEGFFIFIIIGSIVTFAIMRKEEEDMEIKALRIAYFASIFNLIIMFFLSTFTNLFWVILGYLIGSLSGSLFVRFFNRIQNASFLYKIK